MTKLRRRKLFLSPSIGTKPIRSLSVALSVPFLGALVPYTELSTQELKDTPTKLVDILGRYAWVYSGDPDFSGEVYGMFKASSNQDFFNDNHIFLSIGKGKEATPENLTGEITRGTFKIYITGARRVKIKQSKDLFMESFWELVLDQEENEEVWLVNNGNGIGITKVLDDNGCQFLFF